MFWSGSGSKSDIFHKPGRRVSFKGLDSQPGTITSLWPVSPVERAANLEEKGSMDSICVMVNLHSRLGLETQLALPLSLRVFPGRLMETERSTLQWMVLSLGPISPTK